jgi:hypothetical protein
VDVIKIRRQQFVIAGIDLPGKKEETVTSPESKAVSFKGKKRSHRDSSFGSNSEHWQNKYSPPNRGELIQRQIALPV